MTRNDRLDLATSHDDKDLLSVKDLLGVKDLFDFAESLDDQAMLGVNDQLGAMGRGRRARGPQG